MPTGDRYDQACEEAAENPLQGMDFDFVFTSLRKRPSARACIAVLDAVCGTPKAAKKPFFKRLFNCGGGVTDPIRQTLFVLPGGGGGQAGRSADLTPPPTMYSALLECRYGPPFYRTPLFTDSAAAAGERRFFVLVVKRGLYFVSAKRRARRPLRVLVGNES